MPNAVLADYRSKVRKPDDFDAFWNAGKLELAKVALDAKLEHVAKQSDDRVDCYKISLANIEGKRVHGWLSVPKGKGPVPAVLTVPGAGRCRFCAAP